jgi:hypothetical protein
MNNGMLFSFHERKIFYKKPVKYVYIYIYVFINVVIKEYLKCVCVKYIIVSFNMCVRLGSILTSAYAFGGMRFFSSKTETSVFSLKKPTKLECICIYIY